MNMSLSMDINLSAESETGSFILKEDGGAILTEAGDKIKTEESA